MNIEKAFLDTKAIFAKQIKDAAQEALDKLYEEYLPHIENDTYYNVAQKARSLLVRFMSDTLDEHDAKMLKLELQPYSGKQLRQKMFHDNKEELTKAIGQDIVYRLKELEERQRYSHEINY